MRYSNKRQLQLGPGRLPCRLGYHQQQAHPRAYSRVALSASILGIRYQRPCDTDYGNRSTHRCCRWSVQGQDPSMGMQESTRLLFLGRRC